MERLGRSRLAVSSLFLLNGFMMGSWAPKVPVLMSRLGISESTMGMVVLCLGLGSVAMMPIFGGLIARTGSAFAARLAALCATPILLLMSLAPGLWTVAACVVLFGAGIGGMDVAMNSNAVAVERAQRKAIMSSCHGFWSLGGLVGAGFGGVALTVFGEVGHALLATVVVAIGLAKVWPMILEDIPRRDASAPQLRLPREPLPYILGFLALTCMIPEGAILDWAAVYLEKELGASLSVAGWGFAACAGTMAAVRFMGDALRNRMGAVLTLRLGAVVAILGLAVAGMASGPLLAIAGFALAGIGLANMVPIVFSAAGNVAGLANGVSLSIVTTMGYAGILLAPGMIGWLAEWQSLSAIYGGLAVLLLLPLLLSRLVASADFRRE